MKHKLSPAEKATGTDVVGQRIAAVRTERGMSQEALGEKLEPPLRKQGIYQIERGRVHASYLRLVDIARVLRVSYHYLLTGVGDSRVVDSPFKVVSGKSYPVPVVEHPGLRTAEQRYVYVDQQPDPSDRCVDVIDDAMAPEFQKGDETIFRAITPLPGDSVWATDKITGCLLLRTYKKTRDGYELLTKNKLFAPITGGGDIEILGVVIGMNRKYGRAQ